MVIVWLWLTSVALAEPPVAPTAYAEPAPTTNLSRKLGVPLVPSQSSQPEGIAPLDPDQIIITPAGSAAKIAAVTKAVVARLVSLSPELGVGAVGLPVKTGDARSALSAPRAATKAVVAMLVSLSPGVGVGAVGLPVKTGDARGAASIAVRAAASSAAVNTASPTLVAPSPVRAADCVPPSSAAVRDAERRRNRRGIRLHYVRPVAVIDAPGPLGHCRR